MEIVSKIDFFPFLRAFYSNDGVWETLTDSAKLEHCFRLYRTLSIQHPIYMQQNNKIHDVNCLDALHQANKHHNGKQPWWTYTKVKWEKGEQIFSFGENIISEFCQRNGIERKSFLTVSEMFYDEVLKSLNEIKKEYEPLKKPKRKK